MTLPRISTADTNLEAGPDIPLTQMRFGIAERVFLIDCLDHWSANAIRKLVHGWFLKPLETKGTAVDVTMTVRCGLKPPGIPSDLESFEVSDGGTCYADGNSVYIEIDGSVVLIDEHWNHIDVWIRTEYEMDSWILAQVLSQAFCAAMRRCGLFLLHGAGVLPPGEKNGLLIVGPSGTGKSTLAFQLTANGWGYLSDDSIFLKETATGIKAQGLRKDFAFKEDTIAAVQLEIEDAPSRGFNLKKRVPPEDLFPECLIEAAGIESIVFPELIDADKSRLERLDPLEVMTRLLKLCPWACYDKRTAAPYLSILGELARRASGFVLYSGSDLLHEPRAADRLMLQAMQSHG